MLSLERSLQKKNSRSAKMVPDTWINQGQEIFQHKAMTLQTWVSSEMSPSKLKDSLPQQSTAFLLYRTGEGIGEKIAAELQ